jgi:C4-dicarboxylate transporter, DctQ subunit
MVRWFDRLEEGLIAFLLAAMTIITFVQVIARYFFNYSFVWALELVTFLFAGLIFLGMCYGVRVGSHIGVDAVVKMLRPGAARIVTIAATLLCIAYAMILFVGGWRYVDKMYEIGTYAQDMPVPLWLPRLALPVGFGLLVLRFVQILYRTITGHKAKLVGDEAASALKHRVGDKTPPQARE